MKLIVPREPIGDLETDNPMMEAVEISMSTKNSYFIGIETVADTTLLGEDFQEHVHFCLHSLWRPFDGI